MKPAYRVLVVDDEEAIREVFSRALEPLGCEVVAVESGEPALAELGREPVDLIFLDLNMPGINGVETLRALREQGIEAPVYVVSGFAAQYTTELAALRDDGHEFELARKPFVAEDIRTVARAVLGVAPPDAPAGNGLLFRLFTTRAGPDMGELAAALERALTTAAGTPVRLEVVDVLAEPHRAEEDGVLATPALLRVGDEPAARVVGDLADTNRVVAAFGLRAG